MQSGELRVHLSLHLKLSSENIEVTKSRSVLVSTKMFRTEFDDNVLHTLFEQKKGILQFS